ncbi:hypothetical protein QWY75_11695 [Pontixanthobacter aestiaquae]|uniref:Small integral membrane protein n=1 Tax=Pontixanthobacter aestiaquae TaxID=1509367 RepID=A0A844Z5R3_9SPHN|nr:hypothetical protein [Pontixanthobacter aestiaquae]MDN3646865.1 hypothetical protein [Pontixanthobacter aestiaquae]MXO82153.1 hypothetical protein [Pontixanthobacter aestiaquae]
MAVALIFMLGIGNFALHKAVMESGHPLLGQIPWFANGRGRRIAFGLEFAVLSAAMLLAANGWPQLGWGYLIYTGLNAISGWLILSGKV